MINGLIKASFGLHFPETNGLWKEKFLDQFSILCISHVETFWYPAYQNKKTIEFRFVSNSAI